jgi:peroxisomal membrane protein 2
MAVINGARSPEAIKRTVKAGYFSILKVGTSLKLCLAELSLTLPRAQSMWISSPIAIAFAQKFLPAETWVVWFNLVRYVSGITALAIFSANYLVIFAQLHHGCE